MSQTVLITNKSLLNIIKKPAAPSAAEIKKNYKNWFKKTSNELRLQWGKIDDAIKSNTFTMDFFYLILAEIDLRDERQWKKLCTLLSNNPLLLKGVIGILANDNTIFLKNKKKPVDVPQDFQSYTACQQTLKNVIGKIQVKFTDPVLCEYFCKEFLEQLRKLSPENLLNIALSYPAAASIICSAKLLANKLLSQPLADIGKFKTLIDGTTAEEANYAQHLLAMLKFMLEHQKRHPAVDITSPLNDVCGKLCACISSTPQPAHVLATIFSYEKEFKNKQFTDLAAAKSDDFFLNLLKNPKVTKEEFLKILAAKTPLKTLLNDSMLKLIDSYNTAKKYPDERNKSKELLDKIIDLIQQEHITATINLPAANLLALLPELKLEITKNKLILHSENEHCKDINASMASLYSKKPSILRQYLFEQIEKRKPIPDKMAYLILSVWDEIYTPAPFFILQILPRYLSDGQIRKLEQAHPLFKQKIQDKTYPAKIKIHLPTETIPSAVPSTPPNNSRSPLDILTPIHPATTSANVSPITPIVPSLLNSDSMNTSSGQIFLTLSQSPYRGKNDPDQEPPSMLPKNLFAEITTECAALAAQNGCEEAVANIILPNDTLNPPDRTSSNNSLSLTPAKVTFGR
jgi:hypothetical protein